MEASNSKLALNPIMLGRIKGVIWVWRVCVSFSSLFDRYCVLLITGEGEQFVSVNEAFFNFASANTKEVLRFAYVYQKQQQPLCDALLKQEDTTPPQVRDIHGSV